MAVIRSPFSRVPKPVDTSGAAEYYRKVLGRDISGILPSDVSAPDEDVQPADVPVAPLRVPEPFDYSRLGSGATVSPTSGRVGGVDSSGVPSELQRPLASAIRTVGRSAVEPEESEGIMGRLRNIASGVSPVSKVQQLLPDFLADPIESAQGVVKRGVVGALEYPKRAVQAFVDEAAESKTEGPTPLPFNPLTFDYGDWWDKVWDEEYNIEIRPVEGLTGSTGRAARYTDNVIDFVVGEIALDPWTYSTLGAGKFAGAAGRSTLGSELANNADLIAKFGDDAMKRAGATAVRLGEHGVPRQIREAAVELGLMDAAGVRLFGQVIPGTADVAGGLGKAFGATRARLGDVAGGRLSRVATVGSRKALIDIARDSGGKMSVKQIGGAFAKYSAAVKAKADHALWAAQNGAYVRTFAAQLDNDPNSALVIDYLDGVIPIEQVPEVSRGNAELLRREFDRLLEDANQLRRKLAEKHGVQVDEIKGIDDYFMRSLTPEAQDFLRSKKATSGQFKSIVDSMRIDLDEQGSFMQGRVLQKGSDWLGAPLQRGGLNEINERSLAELGFKWFDDAPGSVLAKYVDNIGRDIQRTFFVDELFRLAPDQIGPIVNNVVPNRTIAKGVEKAMTRWTKLLNTYNRRITGDAGSVYSEAQSSLEGILVAARKVADPLFEQSDEARVALRGLRDELDAQLQELEKLRSYADTVSEGLRRDFEAYVNPLERQLRDFRAALDAGEGERFAAKEWLLARHAELFPDAVTRPSQPQQLANQIIRELERVLGGAARTSAVAKTQRQALTTRPDIIVDVAGQNMGLPVVRKEVGRLSRAVSAAKKQYDRLVKNDPDLQDYDNAADQFHKTASRLDAAAALAGERGLWDDTVGRLYQEDIDSIAQILGEMPTGVRVPRIAEGHQSHFEGYDEAIEMVPVELLAGMRGNELNYDVADLSRDISENGIKDPLILIYSTEDKFVRLGEGNHRLQAAIDAGFTHLPARVSRKVGKKWVGGAGEYSGIQVRGWTSPERIPPNIKPSEIMDFEVLPKGTGELTGPSAEAAGAWVRKARTTLDQLNVIEMPEAERDLWDRLFKHLLGHEADLAKAERHLEMAGNIQERLFGPNGLMETVKDDLLADWDVLSRNFQNIQVSPELKEILGEWDDGVRRVLATPEGMRDLSRAYNLYYRWFKSTAILTPGFTVRNGFTAAFNNAVAGVSPKSMRDGVRFARAVREHGGIWGTQGRKKIRTRGGAATVMKRLGLNPQEAEIYDNAFKSVLASGGGQAIDDVAPRLGKSSRVYNSKFREVMAKTGRAVFRPFGGRVSNAARQMNGTVELAVRMGMALDGARKGYTFAENAARIARYHFDYTDLSQLDVAMRRVIPFWLFQSRNVPLQLTNQVMRPGMYLSWNKLSDATEEYEDPLMADWRRRRGGINLPWGAVIDLDLPFQDVQGQLGAFTPMSLLGSATPIIRAPIEFGTGERIAFGGSYPYSTDYRGAGLSDLPAAFAGWIGGFGDAEGATTTGTEGVGGIMVSERFAGPLAGLAPPLGQLQRVLSGAQVPQELLGGPEKYYERDPWAALLGGYGGLGYDRITPEERESTVRSRQYELLDELDKLRQTGKLRER